MLGDALDLSAFDFRTGRINHSQLRKSKQPQGPYDFSRGVLHWLSIFKTGFPFLTSSTDLKTNEMVYKVKDFKHVGHISYLRG